MHTSVLVPPSSIKSFEQHLRSTTALTPTQHGGGGLGSIVSIVAAVAIPFAAPAIATSIGISAALGPTLGSALVGAGLGAASAFATGQNPLMGAAMGGVGGGIGGYMNAPAGVNPLTGNPISVAPAGSGAAGLGYAPNTLTTMPTPVGVQSSLGGVAADFGGATALPGGQPALGYAASNPGVQLSGQPALGYAASNPGVTLSGQPAVGYAGSNPSVTAYPPESFFQPSDPGVYVPKPPASGAFNNDVVIGSAGADDLSTMPLGTQLGPDYRPVGYAGSELTPAALRNIDPTLGERLAGLGDSVKGFFGNPMESIRNAPDYLKYSGVQAGTRALSGLFAPDEPDISPMEAAALEERRRLRQMEEAEQARRRELGDQYMQQARAINPVQLGMESAADAARRYERSSRAGLRNLTGAQRTAGQRRAALDQARLGGSAFNQGFGRGLEQRMAAISRAAGTGANYASLGNMASNDLRAAQIYRNRLNEERANAAGLISPILAGGLFGMTDAERKKLDEKRREISGAGV